MTIETDRQGLLDAIAAAGTAGGDAYRQAQAQLAGQQQEAVRQALAGGIAGNAPAGAGAELTRIVSQGYAPRQAQLTSNQATMGDYYSRLGANANTYMGQAQALIPAINQQFENQLALQMAGGGSGGGGSGGGGGGGGRKGSSSSDDWWSALKDTYDTKTNLYKVLRGSGGPRVPGSIAARQAAGDLGIPEGVIEAQFPVSDYLKGGLAGITTAKSKNVPVHTFRKVAMKNAAATKGNQAVERRYLVDLYRGGPPKPKPKQQQKKKR